MSDMAAIAARYQARLDKRNPKLAKKRAMAKSFNNVIASSLASLSIVFPNATNKDLVGVNPAILDIDIEALMGDKVEMDKLTDAEIRKISVNKSIQIPMGGVFNIEGCNWLVGRVEKLYNSVYDRYQIFKCNYNIKWKDEYGVTHAQECIIYDYTLYSDGLDERLGITTGDSKVGVILPSTTNTNKWSRDDRFLVGEVAYQLAKDDSVTNSGIKRLVMKEVELSPLDDVVNGYAYNSKGSVYTIELPVLTTEVETGLTLQLDAIVKKDDLVTSENVIWTTSDALVATVNSTGLITGVGVGTATITATLEGNSSVLSTIVIDVKAVVVSTESYSLDGAVAIRYGRTLTYELNKFVNGVRDDSYNENLVFSVTSTDKVELVNNSDNTCTLKCLEYGGNVTLSVTQGVTVYNKTINLKSLL